MGATLCWGRWASSTQRVGRSCTGQGCTLLEVVHPVQRPHFDFHIARIYIDDELRIPIRFASWEWPAVAGGSPQLLEEFTYLNIKLNVGLTDLDFDSGNPNYAYPY